VAVAPVTIRREPGLGAGGHRHLIVVHRDEDIVGLPA
jgi:hypothetical protein